MGNGSNELNIADYLSDPVVNPLEHKGSSRWYRGGGGGDGGIAVAQAVLEPVRGR